jgi:REP element-mobilizing transposase RayT
MTSDVDCRRGWHVSALLNSLEGVSARRLRSELTGRLNRHIARGHFWSPSYFTASCGGASQHHPPAHRAGKRTG